MIAIALAFLRVAWPYLLGAILLGAVYYKAQHYCNTVCKDARAERDVLKAEKAAAVKRASELALLWAGQVDKTEAAAKRQKEATDATFTGLANRARSLPSRAVSVSAGVAGVLGAATVAANAARAPEVDKRAPEALPSAPAGGSLVYYDERELSAYVVASAAAYADAFIKWRSCVDFYEGLRKSELDKLREAIH